jgi:hypothetical protein
MPTHLKGGDYGLVVGLETGEITLWKSPFSLPKWTCLHKLHDYFAHGLTVRRIKFGRVVEEEGLQKFTMATCGNDHTVRIFSITL